MCISLTFLSKIFRGDCPIHSPVNWNFNLVAGQSLQKLVGTLAKISTKLHR